MSTFAAPSLRAVGRALVRLFVIGAVIHAAQRLEAQTIDIEVICYDLKGLLLTSAMPKAGTPRAKLVSPDGEDVEIQAWLAQNASGAVAAQLSANRFATSGGQVISLDGFDPRGQATITQNGRATVNIPLPMLLPGRTFLVLSFRRASGGGVTALSPLMAVVRNDTGKVTVPAKPNVIHITVPKAEQKPSCRQPCSVRRCSLFRHRNGRRC